MDGLTHSLVGLTSAKAGLERLSPYATTTCILSANAPDSDFVSFLFGGRWVLLQNFSRRAVRRRGGHVLAVQGFQ